MCISDFAGYPLHIGFGGYIGQVLGYHYSIARKYGRTSLKADSIRINERQVGFPHRKFRSQCSAQAVCGTCNHGYFSSIGAKHNTGIYNRYSARGGRGFRLAL